MKVNLNAVVMVLGALGVGAGLVLLFGWPVLLLLGGAVLILWVMATT